LRQQAAKLAEEPDRHDDNEKPLHIWLGWHLSNGSNLKPGHPMTEIDKSQIIRERLKAAQSSPLQVYRSLTVGERSWVDLFSYELRTMLLSGLGGGIGFLLRRKLYRSLFGRSGAGLIIGQNVTLRHPHRMRFGDGVTIDDLCVLDARGGEDGLVLGENVIINRNCMVLAKAGSVKLGRDTSIGSNCVLVSMSGLETGSSVLVAGGCYFSSGAYHTGNVDDAIMDQGAYSMGPIIIEDNVWIGTGAIILDNVRIGRNAVVGAGAVVTKDVPARAVVAGVPARVVKDLV
jgi:acetyltransferase-like isoleucine patch superfamily enzyme